MWAKWAKYTQTVIKKGGRSFEQGVEGHRTNLIFDKRFSTPLLDLDLPHNFEEIAARNIEQVGSPQRVSEQERE